MRGHAWSMHGHAWDVIFYMDHAWMKSHGTLVRVEVEAVGLDGEKERMTITPKERMTSILNLLTFRMEHF